MLRPALVCLHARDLDSLDTLDEGPVLLANFESKRIVALGFLGSPRRELRRHRTAHPRSLAPLHPGAPASRSAGPHVPRMPRGTHVVMESHNTTLVSSRQAKFRLRGGFCGDRAT